jgi:hypothetical protein
MAHDSLTVAPDEAGVEELERDPTLFHGPSSPEERAAAARAVLGDEQAMQAALVKAVPAAARPLAKLNALDGRPTTWWATMGRRVRMLPAALRSRARPVRPGRGVPSASAARRQHPATARENLTPTK